MNDSIDELLEGLPAEPMLPKKRAKPIDRGPPSQRRLEDQLVVNEATDPRERARREQEASQQPRSTSGTAFLQTNATRQRAVVAVVMMIAVLGTYAFLRHRKKETAENSPQISAQTQTTTPAVSTAPLAPDAVPPPPVATTADPIPNAGAAAKSGTMTHRPKAHADSHSATPAAPSASANTRTDVARSL